MGIGHCLASHNRVTCKLTFLLGLSFIFQPFFQLLNIVICKVLNARGLKWFVPVVHTTAVIDWRQLRKKKRLDENDIHLSFSPCLNPMYFFFAVFRNLNPFTTKHVYWCWCCVFFNFADTCNMSSSGFFFLSFSKFWYGKCGQFFQYFCNTSQIYGMKPKIPNCFGQRKAKTFQNWFYWSSLACLEQIQILFKSNSTNDSLGVIACLDWIQCVKFECPQKFIVTFSTPFKEEAIALTAPMFKKN
jgi:hypothetical protein